MSINKLMNETVKELLVDLSASNKEIEELEAKASNLYNLGIQSGGLIALHTQIAKGRRNLLVCKSHEKVKETVTEQMSQGIIDKDEIALLVYDNMTYYKEDLEAYIKALSGIVEYEIVR